MMGVTPDRVLSATLYFDEDWPYVFGWDTDHHGDDPCGRPDKVLLANDSHWSGYLPPHDWTEFYWEEYVSYFEEGGVSGYVDRLPQGTPAPGDLATFSPAKGVKGIDVAALVRYWLTSPSANNGLVLKTGDIGGENGRGDGDHDAHDDCAARYQGFRLEVTYVPPDPSGVAHPVMSLDGWLDTSETPANHILSAAVDGKPCSGASVFIPASTLVFHELRLWTDCGFGAVTLFLDGAPVGLTTSLGKSCLPWEPGTITGLRVSTHIPQDKSC